MEILIYLSDTPHPRQIPQALEALPGRRRLVCDELEALERQWRAPALILLETEHWHPALKRRIGEQLERCAAPCIVICHQGLETDASDAIQAGVTTFISGHLGAERLPQVLSAARARFERDSQLRSALASAKAQLADRRTIERAKGLLMQSHQLSETQAYRLLRQQAMANQQKIVQLAEQLIKALPEDPPH